jgi:hypothetical protein
MMSNIEAELKRRGFFKMNGVSPEALEKAFLLSEGARGDTISEATDRVLVALIAIMLEERKKENGRR